MRACPSVFISYAYDSIEHADRVLALADWLEENGLEVIFDQYEPAPEGGWPKWMSTGISRAEFVLAICTQKYYERLNEEQPTGTGLGVQWEGSIIYNILASGNERKKFIALQFDNEELSNIPEGFLGNTRFVISQFDLTDPGMESLYRVITNQPKAVRPRRGDIIQLPSRARAVIPRSGEEFSKNFTGHSFVKNTTISLPSLRSARGFKDVQVKRGAKNFIAEQSLANYNRALKEYKRDDYYATIFYAERALKLSKADRFIHKLIGDSYFRLKKYDRAKEQFESLPDEIMGTQSRLRLLACDDFLNDSDDLEKVGHKIVESSQDKVDAVIDFADALSSIGRYKIAIEVLVPYSEDPRVLSSMAVYYWYLGDNEKATEILENLPRGTYDAHDWMNLGVGRAEQGRFGLAIEAIKEGMKQNPDSKFGQFALAELYAWMGDHENAMNRLQLLVNGGEIYIARANVERAFSKIQKEPAFNELYSSVFEI